MYILNNDTGKWELSAPTLPIKNFNNNLIPAQNVALYSRFLSGAVYLPIDNFSNIYDTPSNTPIGYYINASYSNINYPNGPQIPLNQNTPDYDKYLFENAFTPKSLFTPSKAVSTLNLSYADLATTGQIDFNGTFSVIDGVYLLNGQRILVKDQYSTITLSSSTDPNYYFTYVLPVASYNVVQNDVSYITYSYHDNTNGLYSFTQSKLVKLDEINDYQSAYHYSVRISSGTVNGGSEYFLNRLLTNYYPVSGDNLEFIPRHNWLLRNQVDYDDIYDLNYHNILHENALTIFYNSITYSIADRTIVVGDFGTIICSQDGVSHIIFNKVKVDLYGLCSTTNYYFICGASGTILIVSKADFTITEIITGELNAFKSIYFCDDLNGMAVGEFGLIYNTIDGGFTWNKIVFSLENTYNSIIMTDKNTAYIGGSVGCFLELNYTNKWNAYLRKPVKYTDDQYGLVEDINDMCLVNSLTYSIILIAANNNTLLLRDINNVVSTYPFSYVSFTSSVSDINTIQKDVNNSSVYIGADNIYTFDLNTVFNVSNNNATASLTQASTDYVNKIYSTPEYLYLCGNNSYMTYNNYGPTFSILDPNFLSSLTSKLLFLDYDVAAKLNFYNGDDYILPTGVSFSNTYSIAFTPDNNWLSYYQDSIKTFAYYTNISDTNTVTFSPTFSFTYSNTFTFSNISASYSASFAPNIWGKTASRFIAGTNSIDVSAGTSYDLLLYNYLAIFKFDINDAVDVGDVLYLQSGIIDNTLLVNKIIAGSFSEKYVYCYTDYNQNIVNNLVGATASVKNLNKYVSPSDLANSFDNHPIGLGYGYSYDATYSYIEPLYNNLTAYYNMETVVNSLTMSYTYSYNRFGFTPKYNIADYLGAVNTDFNPGKKFTIMPEYVGLPGNGGNSATNSNIYIDPSLPTNALIFGANFNFHYESLLVNTFVDINIYGNLTYNFTRFLIIKKENNILYFNKQINIPTNEVMYTLDILSRNTLSQISSDLNLLNNISRSTLVKQIQTGYNITNDASELSSKFPTDSYLKILASDYDIRKYVSGIVYTDLNNIAINMLNTDKQLIYDITATTNYGSNLFIQLANNYIDLNVGDFVFANFTGGSMSSQYLNPQYNGFQTITAVTDTGIVTSAPFGVNSMINDTGTITFVKKDPFLNYIPIDLYDISSNDEVTISVMVSPENYILNGASYSLVGVDTTNYNITFVDGLTLDNVNANFNWILQAELRNAIIGYDNNGIVWYSGTWLDGRWFGGTWKTGTWFQGDWFGGTWVSGTWYNGRWYDGTWSAGSWFNGRWYGGTWYSGTWYGGIWNDGHWIAGDFLGGVWVNGSKDSGLFNCNAGPSYWLYGVFNGDFENGLWFDGRFGDKTFSRFGTKSSNTRNAIWNGGIFINGEFHSLLNTDSSGNPIVSAIHRYSQFNTGQFLNGHYYGGIAANINMASGIWHGGILDDIQVCGIDVLNNNITLNGNFYFNIGDYIWIDNCDNTPFSDVGSVANPKKYRIDNVVQNNGFTVLYLDFVLSNLNISPPYNTTAYYDVETNLRIASYFSKNTTWQTGLFGNGIMDGHFINGVVYNGVINGDYGI